MFLCGGGLKNVKQYTGTGTYFSLNTYDIQQIIIT
jgi:hypothetical protein